MKIAMISYNTFVLGAKNGWQTKGGNSVLLLQNSDGKAWGTSQSGQTVRGWHAETAAIVDPLWAELQKALPTLDKVVMYVGSYGAERVIELAKENGLTPDRAVFVLCDCNWNAKLDTLLSCGFAGSQMVECSCGGHVAMSQIYESALTAGELPC